MNTKWTQATLARRPRRRQPRKRTSTTTYLIFASQFSLLDCLESMLIGFHASSKAGGSQWKEKPAAKIVFTTESADDQSSGENRGGYHRRIIRRASSEKSFARCLWLRGTPASSEGEFIFIWGGVGSIWCFHCVWFQPSPCGFNLSSIFVKEISLVSFVLSFQVVSYFGPSIGIVYMLLSWTPFD